MSKHIVDGDCPWCLEGTCDDSPWNRTPAHLLRRAAELFEERNPVYGDSYTRVGKLLAVLFPDGIQLTTEEDFSRYHTFQLCLMKLVRYGNQLQLGGHLDSARDLQVYAAILESKTK